MVIYVYSDESGVFDQVHDNIFVFGGLLFLSKEEKDNFNNMYLHAERSLRIDGKYKEVKELKASAISNKDKGKLFRATNNCYRFGIVIHMDIMLKSIFENKKSKQRFLDYAYKVGLKRYLQNLIDQAIIKADEVDKIIVAVDEHSTATNGIYELREAMLQEYKVGTFNENWSKFFPPIFPNLKDVQLQYCDSSKKPMVRAADIIANRLYFKSRQNKLEEMPIFITHLP